MAKKTIIVCDICESDQEIKAWEVKDATTGDKKKAELCKRHGEILEVIVHGFEQATPPSTPSRRRGRNAQAQVVSMEEIEAQKATQGA